MKIQGITLALITLMFISFSSSVAAETSPALEISYDVISANTGNITWFSPDYSQSFNYTFEGVNKIFFSLENTSLNTAINVTIGNFSVTDYPDTSIDGNLILSYWEVNYDLGVLANNSWANFDVAASAAKSLISYSMNESSMSIMKNGAMTTVDTVIIDFVSTYQNTTLIYEKSTGILLEADTGFGNYFVHFKVSSITMKGTTSDISETVTTSTDPKTNSTETTSDVVSNDLSETNETPILQVTVIFTVLSTALILRRKV